jgi:DNA-binding HxlR family transcriptional regulator
VDEIGALQREDLSEMLQDALGKSAGVSGQRDEDAAEGLSAGCPMAALLEMLTRPWTLHILWLLSTNGPMRFGALRRAAEGISARLLTVRLRTLEAEGFLQRTVRAGKMPEVTYTPTRRLADMGDIMARLHAHSVRWQSEADGKSKGLAS